MNKLQDELQFELLVGVTTLTVKTAVLMNLTGFYFKLLF
jgi:hypothetical protein